MSERASSEIEIYSGANERPDYLIRFPGDVTDEQIAEFEERYVAARAARKSRPTPAPIDLSWVTTEPVYEGPKWLNWTLLGAKLLLLCMLAAIAVAVVVKA